ncbi:hypothetical protein BDV28DRAFT_159548 [Aspergillus coremiiformis]|uniref:FAD-binding PCMH-type domain-containing protein n=1 Tax=Aspergillus coremiiformis TaxID=138285 RepID=A0A5N6Z0Q1_9EURO|nr:hypothetical protein BDV28DRAFT_159548 [Aspergillus coremiiformis]
MDQLLSGLISSNTTVGDCCLVALACVLGNKLSFPGTQPYHASLESYFSQQNARLQPHGIISPTTTEDVSTAIKAIASTLENSKPSNCNFAIRSGGHAAFVGAANIANGVTLDLQGLNQISVSDDYTTASIGVGATWGEVYSQLDPLGLSVAGGRAAQVGVGGLTTGGGISYFSPRYGWACDTVTNFEVVLANGTIANANEEENAELMVALRGGSNNFGVVTRVDMRTFEQGPLWGGSVYHSVETIEQNLKAFVELNSAEAYDEFASLITSFGFASGRGKAVVNSMEYTKAEEDPAVFRPFMEIPKLLSTMRIASMHEISMEQGSFQPDGRRQLGVVTTHGSALPMLNATYLHWDASLAAIQDIPGIIWSISLEPLPPAIYARSPSNNAMGLDDASDSLVVTLLSATWDDEVDDAKVEKAARELFDNIESDARKLDVYEPFVYLNYAAPWQDPITSYKSKSVERLRRVSQDVDPKGLFRLNVPGGFKLSM